MTSKSVSVPITTTGYGSSNSTKVIEQRMRAQRCTSNDVIFDDNTPTATSQAAFLANSHNKNRLIQAVREKMPMFGIRVKQAEADADTLIISTALHVAESAEAPLVVKKQHYDRLDIFTTAESTHKEVKKAGESFIQLYGASNFQSLDEYCHVAYKRAIGRSSLSSSFQLETYPQPVLQQSNIPTVLTLQFSSGWEILCRQQNGDGDHRTEALNQ